jgi:hypothetical protein
MKNLLILILPLLFSCSVVNKIFHKEKVSRDSTSVIHERKDSIATTDSSTFHKEENKSWWKYDTVTKKDNSVITEVITQEKFDTSGKLSEKITTNRKIENNKQTESSSTAIINNHSQIDSNELKKQANNSEVKNNETKVSEKKKTVLKEVRKKRTYIWWLLLLIPAYLVYRNWPKIKAWIMLILPI